MSDPVGYIKLAISIPITAEMVSPDDCPAAGDVMEWLTEEYPGPVGVVADYYDEADSTMIVVWQDGQEAMRHTVAAGWTEPPELGTDPR